MINQVNQISKYLDFFLFHNLFAFSSALRLTSCLAVEKFTNFDLVDHLRPKVQTEANSNPAFGHMTSIINEELTSRTQQTSCKG